MGLGGRRANGVEWTEHAMLVCDAATGGRGRSRAEMSLLSINKCCSVMWRASSSSSSCLADEGVPVVLVADPAPPPLLMLVIGQRGGMEWMGSDEESEVKLVWILSGVGVGYVQGLRGAGQT